MQNIAMRLAELHELEGERESLGALLRAVLC